MKKIALLVFLCLPAIANATVLDTMLSELKAQAGGEFTAAAGERMWIEEHVSKKDGKKRSCTTCHTKNLKNVGKHKKTGKKIDPLAVSVTKDRLTDRKKINKWFKRNCKWTLGRECNAQEKGDFLMYINSQ